MALRTSNLYGKIYITNRATKTVVTETAAECYGVAWARAGHLVTLNNRVVANVNIVLKFGVSVEAVIDSVRSAIKYNVENFTGMIVECVNIDVLGIKN